MMSYAIIGDIKYPVIMPDLEDYLTTDQAAVELNLHIETIRLFMRFNKLEGFKFGRTWLVSKKSVAEYKAKNEGKSKHDPTRETEI